MRRRELYGAMFALVGFVLAAVQVVQALQVSGSTLDLAFNAFPFGLMAIAIAYAGYWLATAPEYEVDIPVVAAWGVGGSVAFASVTALVLFSQPVSETTLAKAPYAAIDNLTVGALAGLLVGLYDARSRHRLRELERQRDRMERFANRAADMNNYGRVLSQCSNLDDVSALCIEAAETLVGVSGAAVIAPDDGELTPLHSTIRGVDRTALVSLAERVGEQDVATAIEIEHADLPADFGDDVVAATTLLVAELEAGPVAIVALVREGTEIADEDVDLLEMLVSHASTTVRNMDHRTDAATADD